jgi:hypothetical protein
MYRTGHWKDTAWNSSGQGSEYSAFRRQIYFKAMGAHIVVEPWYHSHLPTATMVTTQDEVSLSVRDTSMLE